ncbi:Peptidase family M20/M25/M40 [compost metagenome]
MLVNSTQETAFARRIGEELAGADQVQDAPTVTGSEDFAWMLQRCPGSYLFIGNGTGAGRPMVHNPGYDFNDEILVRGAAYWAALAEAWFQAPPANSQASTTAA